MISKLPIIVSAVLLACGSPAAVAGDPADNNGTTQAERRIYVDPETGERRQPTAAELNRERQAEDSQAARRAEEQDSRVLEGEDGSKTIIHDSADWPKRRATRPDNAND